MSFYLRRNKTFIIIFSLIIVSLFGSVIIAPFALWIVSFIGFYWYIVLPTLLIVMFCFNVFNKRKYYKDAYLSLTTEARQKEFEIIHNQQSTEDGELTQLYVQWLMKDVSKDIYTPKNVFAEVYSVIFAVIIFILIGLVFLSLWENIPFI